MPALRRMPKAPVISAMPPPMPSVALTQPSSRVRPAVAGAGVEAEADGDVDGEVGVEELPQAAVRESRAAAASARGRCMVMGCPS